MSSMPIQTSMQSPAATAFSSIQPTAKVVAQDAERMGRIVAVTGAHAIIMLDAQDAMFSDAQRSPDIGTLLKAETANSITLALVSALSAPSPTNNPGDKELRIVEVEFIGELPKGADGIPRSFRRGISGYPSLGDAVYRANRAELALAYACDAASSVRVGYIQQDPSIPVPVVPKIAKCLPSISSILIMAGIEGSCWM